MPVAVFLPCAPQLPRVFKRIRAGRAAAAELPDWEKGNSSPGSRIPAFHLDQKLAFSVAMMLRGAPYQLPPVVEPSVL